MPGYIAKQLTKYNHDLPDKTQHCPYTPAPKKHGKEAQAPAPVDTSPKLPDNRAKHIQRIVGSILYYARGGLEIAHGIVNNCKRTSQCNQEN